MPSFIYLLAAYGLAFFLTHKFNVLDGKIPLLDRTMECAFCMGFHSGGVIFLAWGLATESPNWALWPVWNFACAVFCYALDTAIQRLER